MTTVIVRLLGQQGEQPKCRVLGDWLSVHWFYADAKVGDPCTCGAARKRDDG